MTVHPDDIAGVTAWFDTLGAHVRDVDFVGAPWLAQHTHLSLFRDVPTRSFKSKPEKR